MEIKEMLEAGGARFELTFSLSKEYLDQCPIKPDEYDVKIAELEKMLRDLISILLRSITIALFTGLKANDFLKMLVRQTTDLVVHMGQYCITEQTRGQASKSIFN